MNVTADGVEALASLRGGLALKSLSPAAGG